MTRIFQVVVVVLVVAFCFGQMALAEKTSIPGHAQLLQRGSHSVNPETAPAKNLHIQWADFATSGTNFGALNTDGSPLWPCFGNYDGTDATSANKDCPTIGDPTQYFGGGAVMGVPAYVWGLSFCNATSTTQGPCADQETFIEDTTADITDDTFVTMAITQGTTTIANIGTQDYGPDPFGLTAAQYPVIWVNFNIMNLGNMGITTGPNNGNCLANFNYPLPAAAFNPPYYIVQSNKTCGAAVSGLASGSFTVELAAPKYTKSTLASVCGTVGPPCYTVKFTKKYSATAKFVFWLE